MPSIQGSVPLLQQSGPLCQDMQISPSTSTTPTPRKEPSRPTMKPYSNRSSHAIEDPIALDPQQQHHRASPNYQRPCISTQRQCHSDCPARLWSRHLSSDTITMLPLQELATIRHDTHGTLDDIGQLPVTITLGTVTYRDTLHIYSAVKGVLFPSQQPGHTHHQYQMQQLRKRTPAPYWTLPRSSQPYSMVTSNKWMEKNFTSHSLKEPSHSASKHHALSHSHIETS